MTEKELAKKLIENANAYHNNKSTIPPSIFIDKKDFGDFNFKKLKKELNLLSFDIVDGTDAPTPFNAMDDEYKSKKWFVYKSENINKIKLVYPSEKYLKSYKQAYKEYVKHNITTYNLDDPDKVDVIKKSENYRYSIDLPEGFVPQITYWLVENDEFIGQIGLRPKINDFLLNYGGHIGYFVKYSKWNKGYGTKMLNLVLNRAKKLGLKKVLITCNDDNYGSSKVIEKNGGQLENKVKNNINGKEILTRRYWIEL